mgnify:CR=1 FL=1|jgi:hypothetical protein
MIGINTLKEKYSKYTKKLSKNFEKSSNATKTPPPIDPVKKKGL